MFALNVWVVQSKGFQLKFRLELNILLKNILSTKSVSVKAEGLAPRRPTTVHNFIFAFLLCYEHNSHLVNNR